MKYHYVCFTDTDKKDYIIRIKQVHINGFQDLNGNKIDFTVYKNKTKLQGIFSVMFWSYCVKWQEYIITFSEDSPSFFTLKNAEYIQYLGTDEANEKNVHIARSRYDFASHMIEQVNE